MSDVARWLRHALYTDMTAAQRETLRKRYFTQFPELETWSRAVNLKQRSGGHTMPKMKVWIDSSGNLFHDSCFNPGESRDGYVEADLNQIDIDAACESCNGQIFGDVDDDDDESDEDEVQA